MPRLRKSRSAQPDETAKLPGDIVQMLRVICTVRRTSVADVLEPHIRKPVTRAYAEVMAELSKASK